MKYKFIILICFCSYVHSNYLDRDEVHEFIDFMSKEHDFDKTYLVEVFSKAVKQQNIIDSMNKPAEKVVTWDQYKNRVSFFRIQSGKVFLNTYERWFDKAEKDFGVPREVIAAIIGLETNYGGYKGKIRVIDALSTAAFDYPRRRSFFKKQLEEFFLLSREENFDITGVRGSYAGAMGFAQFMPDNYRRLALDFDEDGKRDIMNNAADAIGSVANFLSSDLGNKRGWDRNGFIALPAQAKRKNKSIKSSFKLVPYKELDIVYEDDNFDFSKKYIQISLFPKNEETGYYIDIVRLRPQISDTIKGEQLHFTCKFSKVNPKQDGCTYNVVSSCTYENTKDEPKAKTIWEKIETKLKKENETGENISLQKSNFMAIDACRHYIDNSFDFV